MTSFWDDPRHRPPTNGTISIGEVVVGQVQSLALIEDQFNPGQHVLAVQMTDDTGRHRTITARTALWRALAQARIEAGDVVQIGRLPDRPLGGGKTVSQWSVQRVNPLIQPAQTPTPAPAAAPAAAAFQPPAPQWGPAAASAPTKPAGPAW